MNETEFDLKTTDTKQETEETSVDMLSALSPSPGFKLSIYRSRPAWVSTGWIETIDFGPDTDFSLDWLFESHGGGTYVLRMLNPKGHFVASNTVKLAGDPKVEGRIITAAMAKQEAAKLGAVTTVLPAQNQNNQTNEMTLLIKMLFENLAAAQKENLSLLSAMFKNQSPGGSMATEIRSVLGIIDDIKTQTQPATGENSEIGSLMNLISSFLQTKQAQTNNQPVNQRKPNLPPMIGPRKPIQQPVQPPIAPIQQPIQQPIQPTIQPIIQPLIEPMIKQPIQPPFHPETNSITIDQTTELDDGLDNQEEISLADEIAELATEDIIDLLKNVMELLPVDKMQKLAEHFNGGQPVK